MKICKVAKRGKIGETSSKYGYDKTGKSFLEDLQKHSERSQYLWDEFVCFMKSHDVCPGELRELFTKYYEEYLK